jgi:hypothetical protein
MTSSGKAARRQGGNRYACKRGRARKAKKAHGSLPWSHKDGKGNAANFRGSQVATCQCAAGCPGIHGGTHVAQRQPRDRDFAHDRLSEVYSRRGAA